MKLFFATMAVVLSVCTAHAATTFTFNDASRLGGGSDPDVDIGTVQIQLTNPEAGKVAFNIFSNNMTAGLEITNAFFTLDFDVNAGGLGLPLIRSIDPANKAGDYAVDEGGFNPIAGLKADAVQRFDTRNGGLVRNDLFIGEFQRFNLPDGGDLTDLNFTQVGIQVDGQGYFVDPVSPIPVPASLPLLAGGLGLAGFALRRGKRKHRQM